MLTNIVGDDAVFDVWSVPDRVSTDPRMARGRWWYVPRRTLAERGADWIRAGLPFLYAPPLGLVWSFILTCWRYSGVGVGMVGGIGELPAFVRTSQGLKISPSQSSTFSSTASMYETSSQTVDHCHQKHASPRARSEACAFPLDSS